MLWVILAEKAPVVKLNSERYGIDTRVCVIVYIFIQETRQKIRLVSQHNEGYSINQTERLLFWY